MAEPGPDMRARVAAVRRRMEEAALRVGRDPEELTLVAVGKTKPTGELSQAVAAGATDLGENRVQEAASKRPEVRGARWHLIGPLQRNKAGRALEVFDLIHTIDRHEIADRVQLLLERDWPDRRQPVLVEVNVGEEPQKAGVLPDETADLVRHVLACDRLELQGLMAIPPFADAEASRPFYQQLRALRDRLQDETSVALPHLSMGMSHDFEVAVEEGATLVRVGTAIFGRRG